MANQHEEEVKKNLPKLHSKATLSEPETSPRGPSLSMRVVLAGIRTKFPSVSHLSTNTFHGWLTAGKAVIGEEERSLLILDARPDNEFEVSHIDGAIQINHDEDISAILQKINYKNQDIGELLSKVFVCYCSVGYRSSIAAEKISKALKSHSSDGGNPTKQKIHVYSLEGSLFKWANELRPMVDKNQQPTRYVHPYNAVWGKLVDSSLRKYNA